MNRKTRYFLIGASLVVLVGLCTGLVAYYGGQARLDGAPSEFAYLSPDVTVIAFADVDGIMRSDFREQLRQVLPESDGQDRLLEETGIDVERDVDTVVAGLSSADLDGRGGVVLLRGTFDAARVERLATDHGAEALTVGGTRVLAIPTERVPDGLGVPDGDGEDRAGIAFLEPDLIALGPLVSLERAIDTGQSSDNVTRNEPLMDFATEISRTGNAWMVGRLEALASAPTLPKEVQSRLSGIEWFAVSAQVDQGLQGFLRAEAVDEASAEELRQLLAGGLAIARLAGGEDPRVDRILESLQPSGTGQTVQISFALEPDLIELLREHAPSLPAPGLPGSLLPGPVD